MRRDDPRLRPGAPLNRPSRSLCAAAALLLAVGLACAAPQALAIPLNLTTAEWTARFEREVDHRLTVPPEDQARYTTLLKQALADAKLDAPAQVVLLIDRSPQVQAALIVMHTGGDDWLLIGATAVSTGKVGTYDHFLTPLGVFPHTLDNRDFRAEGTLNENHIRGYGKRGMRVFDFGWQQAERGWGSGAVSQMRLQMHATDPNVLEARLGNVASEGCIRIPATLNLFLDTHGFLDAAYEDAVAEGNDLWVLKPDRQTIAQPGQYMVIVDSMSTARPAWSPAPRTSR